MYKLINKQTGEEHICEKVVIDGWDYYVIDTGIGCKYGISKPNQVLEIKVGYDATLYKGIVCTNNPSIDIPKVVDEVEIMANLYCKEMDRLAESHDFNSFKYAYNKSQETHPYSDDDMIEFGDWCNESYEFDNRCNQWFDGNGYYTTKELLQLWKEQRTKILYYL